LYEQPPLWPDGPQRASECSCAHKHNGSKSHGAGKSARCSAAPALGRLRLGWEEQADDDTQDLSAGQKEHEADDAQGGGREEEEEEEEQQAEGA